MQSIAAATDRGWHRAPTSHPGADRTVDAVAGQEADGGFAEELEEVDPGAIVAFGGREGGMAEGLGLFVLPYLFVCWGVSSTEHGEGIVNGRDFLVLMPLERL